MTENNKTKEIENQINLTLSLDELKVRASAARREAERLESLVEDYEETRLRKEYGADFREEKCKFSAVHDSSVDYHNKCGNAYADCTCCCCPCRYYQPDNEISQWIKDNLEYIEKRVATALLDLRLPLYTDGTEEQKELIKQILKIRYHWKLKKQP